jgi:hypothetical protein
VKDPDPLRVLFEPREYKRVRLESLSINSQEHLQNAVMLVSSLIRSEGTLPVYVRGGLSRF